MQHYVTKSSTLCWKKDLIHGWMKKVNLLKAHCTLCLGSQITHISEGQHTVHCVGVCQTHTCYNTIMHTNTHIIASRGVFSARCLKRCGSSWRGLKQL